jgi:DDE superfamily endonuclease
VARHRARWKRYQDKIDPKRLVFIDESWVILGQAQDQYGAAPGPGRAKAKRRVARVPYGHWKTSTFVAALRCDGIEAPCVFDGPINSARFLAYIEQVLVPTLRPGDIVALDNPGSHKSKAGQDAIRAAGANRIFLPAYSPDLNPIDPLAGSGGLRQDETSMRKAGARTIDATWKPRSTTSRRKNAQTISGTQDMRHQNPDLDEIWSFVYAKQKNIRRQTLPQKTLAMFGHGLRSTPIARLFHRGVLANGVQKPGLLL